MDQFIEILKQVALVLGVLAPAVKLLLGWALPPKNLEERYLRIERFFNSGPFELPPMLMEASFGTALGHLKLSAPEIHLILKQAEPTRFVERYLQVQQYLAPSAATGKFALRSAAASPFWRNVVRLVSFLFYTTFAAVSGWLGLFGIPMLLAKANWSQAAGAAGLCFLFGAAAWFCIIEGRRVTWAIQLHASQSAT